MKVHRSLIYGTVLTAGTLIIEAWTFFLLWSSRYQSTAPDIGFMASTIFTMIITAVTGVAVTLLVADSIEVENRRKD